MSVEKDGRLIAEVTNDSGWKQNSGKPMEKELVEKICERIEDHYS